MLFSGNHTISNPDEESRIVSSNGFGFNGRVNGTYPYTRSIGDLHLKEKDNNGKSLLVCEPSVFNLRREDILQVFLGTGGVWERPEEVAKNMLMLGKTCKEDVETLEILVSNMIAKDPTVERIGMENILLTEIKFKH